MPLTEMLPLVQSLPRTEKLRLIELLTEDVASDDQIARNFAEKCAPIWSPHDSFQGAATLLRLLEEDRVSS